VNAFIGKPFQESDLLEHIVQVTRDRRQQLVYH